MTGTDVSTVSVFGAGTMGHGIAEVAALAGFDVFLRDVSEVAVQDGYEQIEWSLEMLEDRGELSAQERRDCLDRITAVVDVETAVEGTDYVIEAVPERLELKTTVYEEIERHAPADAILSTNTSCLSIEALAEGTRRPERFCGMHFFSPALRMDLVEVIPATGTADETVAVVEAVTERMGKTPIRVRKDSPAFIVNRVINPLCNEAAWIVEGDDATMAEVDATAVHDLELPMGAFEIVDLAGVDIVVDVLEYLTDRKGPAYAPSPVLLAKQDAGDLGQKTGRGFYAYDGASPTHDPADARADLGHRLLAVAANETAKLVQEDVAAVADVDTGMCLGAGFPEGPAAMADDVGTDTLLKTLTALSDRTGAPRYEPADLLVGLAEDDRGFASL